jgi:hypothetical protein
MKVIMGGNKLKLTDRINNLWLPVSLGDYISTVLIIEMRTKKFS